MIATEVLSELLAALLIDLTAGYIAAAAILPMAVRDPKRATQHVLIPNLLMALLLFVMAYMLEV